MDLYYRYVRVCTERVPSKSQTKRSVFARTQSCSQFGEEVRQILQHSDAYKTTFTDDGIPDIVCNSIIWSGSGSAEQRKAFVQLQKAASSLMLAGGRSFEQVVKKVGGIYKKLAPNAGESIGGDDAWHTR